MRNIEFAKNLLSGDSNLASLGVTATAHRDSDNGSVVVAVGEQLVDHNGDYVPEYDEDGNEVGVLGNTSEVGNIGSVQDGDAVNMVNGYVVGTFGGGDLADENTEAAAKSATDYIEMRDDGMWIKFPDSKYAVRIDNNSVDIMGPNPMATEPEFVEHTVIGDTVNLGNDIVSTALTQGSLQVKQHAVAQGAYTSTYTYNGINVSYTDKSGNVVNVRYVPGGMTLDGFTVLSKSNVKTGAITASNVPKESYVDDQITFSPPLPSAPIVVAGLLPGTQTIGIGSCDAAALNVTKDGFTLRRYNAYTSDRTFGARWIAVV